MAAATNTPSSLNQFALKLYNQMSAGKVENFFISPYSISTALAMCLAGARNETATQLKELLNVADLTDQQILDINHSYVETVNNSLGKDIKINTANKIYPHKGFQIHKEYIDLLSKYFHSEIQLLDYHNATESAEIINSWVAQKTADKIKNLVDPGVLNDLTRLVLVNAIYFKGNWLTPFKADQTGKEAFNLADGSQKQVDMMRLYNKKFKYLASPGGLNADALELPYEGKTISMTIVLPHKSHKLEAVEKQLTAEVLQEILNSQYGSSGSNTDPIDLQVPKFKLEYKEELSEVAKKLGAPLPFDNQRADFTGITSERGGLYISKVLHQAVVEVNEQGTEAAAATAVVMMTRMAMVQRDPFDFLCDRPFVFIIHDKVNNSILFYGKYAQPA